MVPSWTASALTLWLLSQGAAGAAGNAAGSVPDRVRYDGHRLVRVQPRDDSELELVLQLSDDVWTERVGLGPLDARIAPEQMPTLDASGLPYTVLIDDVQRAVDLERERLSAPLHAAAPGPFFSDFKDYAAVDAYLDTLASEASANVEVLDVGQSLEGRDIRALKIGTPGQGKAGLVLTGTMHAREWLSTMVTTCIADRLARDYGSDPEVTELLDTLDVFVIPIINPDGYVYSWQADRYWRKNRRNGHGVDLNRNWGHGWGGAGASTDPYDETYRGSGPFSEPETQVVSQFIAARPQLVGHIDFHSYAELIIYPWGCCYEAAPDQGELSGLAQGMSEALYAVNGRSYQPIQGANFYPAAGAVDDWSYGDQDLRAFTIELRGNDFVISPAAIAPTCDENFAAVLELADWALQFSDPVPAPGGTTGPAGTTGAPPSPDPQSSSGAPVPTDTDQPPPDDPTSSLGSDSGSDGPTDTDGSATAGLEPDALPPGFGDDRPTGCGCSSSRQPLAPAAVWLPLLLVTARRLRGPSTGCSA